MCVTETWLTATASTAQYSMGGYNSFYNLRAIKTGGGVMVFVRDSLQATQITSDVTNNDAFNLCAITIGNRCDVLTAFVVYRAPWATYND